MPLTINGEEVDEGLIDAEFGQIKAHFEQQANVSCCERDDEFLGYAKDNIIARVLLAQDAAASIPTPEGSEIDTRLAELKEQAGGEEAFYFQLGIPPGDESGVRRDIATSMQVDRLVERVGGDPAEPDSEAIEAYYDEHSEEFMSPEEVRASHIFKSLQRAETREDSFAELRKVRARAVAGDDFMELVRQHSDKPEDEADLGWYKRGELMEEFELVTFSMEVGEISPVFATQWGMHLAKVTGHKPPEPLPLDDVRDTICEQIIAEARDAKLKTYIEALREKATIADEPEEAE